MNFINQLKQNSKKKKVYSFFRNNVWGVDLDDMKSMSKYNKGNQYLWCEIDSFS